MSQLRDRAPTGQAQAQPCFAKLSVLMPVYNEIRTLRTIIHRVLHAPISIPIELVIVDDGSKDGSREVIQELAAADPRIRYSFHAKNQGKAEAIRTAVRAMTGDLALIQDADLEYNPKDYPALLRPMLDGVADAVFGSRFRAGEYTRVLYFWHTVANRLLTLFCNVVSDLNLTDMETGYKLIRADVLRAIPLTSDGFALEPELTIKLSQWALRIYEVPISYQGRTYEEGKKIGLKDAFAALWAIFKYRYLSRRFTTHEGFYLLQSARKARGYNRWMMRHFQPYLGRRVLQVGCGIGNFSERLLDRERLICVDTDPFFVDRVQQRFGHLENVSAHQLDPAVAVDYSVVREAEPDTILCTNILEHVADDAPILRAFHATLPPGGRLIALAPQHPGLYTCMDQSLGHCRRYTPDEFAAKLQAAGFEVESLQGFNRLGGVGWLVAGKLFRRRTLTPGQMRLFEWVLPIARLVERIPLLPHLSIIGVGRKPMRTEHVIDSQPAHQEELVSVPGIH